MNESFHFEYKNGEMSVIVEDNIETLDEAVYRMECFLKACGFEFKELTIVRAT